MRGDVIDNTGKQRISNSPYYDKRSPESVYEQGMRDAKQRYDNSAIKKFFDFVQGDQVKQLYDDYMTRDAEKQLGDLIANSPDIVEGWKQGNETERAYVSNLNPFAQNLIEEQLSTQVANEYMGQVNAGLRASDLMVSPTATEEQLAAERSRIMADASERTGYGQLKPYWIAQTAADVSRIQAASEAEIDATRQRAIADLGLERYGQAYASQQFKQSQELTYRRTDPNWTDEMEAQGYQMWSDLIKQDVEQATEATVATPSTHLATFLKGLDTQIEKLIADGEQDAALLLIKDIQEVATSKDLILANGLNYWAQTDSRGNSGYDRLNALKERARTAGQAETVMTVRRETERMLNSGMSPEETRLAIYKRFPGYQPEALTVINGYEKATNALTDEGRAAYIAAYTDPNLDVEKATRVSAQFNLPMQYTQRLLDKAEGKTGGKTIDEQIDSNFGNALKSEKILGEVDQLAYELITDTSPAALRLKDRLEIVADGVSIEDVRAAIIRTIRAEGYTNFAQLQASGELVDEEGEEINLFRGAQDALSKQIEELREVANYEPVFDKPDQSKDPNLRSKTWMQLYAQRKAANVSGMELFEPEFVEAMTAKGIIQEGQSVAVKERALAKELIRIGERLKDRDGNLIYPNQEFVKKIMRGEIDPFTSEPPTEDRSIAPAPIVVQPRNAGTSGSRRRFYRRPEPSPDPEPNPFAEPPLPMQKFPDGTGGGPDEEQANAALKVFTDGLAKIAGTALDVATGAAPANAQIDNEQGVNEMAKIWMGRERLQAGTPPLPQINGNVVVKVIPMQMTSPKHPYFVSIGIAEGTRTPDGGYTKAWFGHTDPGDGNSNRGTVSGGRGPTAGMTPEQVDNYYMKTLTALSLAAAPVLQSYGIKPNAQVWHRALFNYLDLYVQSPVAARDFLRKVPEALKAGSQIEAFAKIRADSYRDPASGRLYTSFNSYADLLRDQRSRAGAFDYRKRL